MSTASGLETKIPPPIVMLLTSVLMWGSARVLPAAGFGNPLSIPLAILFAIAGGLLALLAFIEFQKAKTTVNPLDPNKTASLVTTGIYRYSRNPIYVGDMLILFGWAIYLSNVLAFIVTSVFVLYINRFQINPEERVLGEKFGAQFSSYCESARRWI